MTSRSFSPALLAGLAASTVALTACATAESSNALTSDISTPAAAAPSTSPSPDAVEAPDFVVTPQLDTVTDGVLTIATSHPAAEPWFVEDDPTSAQGFESAVAYVVAEQLGYSAAQVQWVRVSAEQAMTPGEKDWDLGLQQFVISEKDEAFVDFSSAYYEAGVAVLAHADSPLADADSIAALGSFSLGAPKGTPAYAVAERELGRDALTAFETVEDTVEAFEAGEVDGFIIELPEAFDYAAAGEGTAEIIGQFAADRRSDDFAFLLPDGSPNTSTVTAVVDALDADGTLAALETQWLSTAIDVPVLQ
ncbi:substrate-binding periplasmic protein [Demequina sediminicola]|uniref:substrate-binding periplasmic protein n=1 Tax=Demequina sediminicola TaxID=1095026 RepID=UPI000780AE26|nr:transporter substrate-binding domain-containing protein [Demequina sediminicola]